MGDLEGGGEEVAVFYSRSVEVYGVWGWWCIPGSEEVEESGDGLDAPARTASFHEGGDGEDGEEGVGGEGGGEEGVPGAG